MGSLKNANFRTLRFLLNKNSRVAYLVSRKSNHIAKCLSGISVSHSYGFNTLNNKPNWSSESACAGTLFTNENVEKQWPCANKNIH